jgi:hypothetical protein
MSKLPENLLSHSSHETKQQAAKFGKGKRVLNHQKENVFRILDGVKTFFFLNVLFSIKIFFFCL